MKKIPVLFLVSSDIDLKILNDSPRFLLYCFFSLAAIRYLENSSSRVPGQQLQDFLSKKIRRVKPLYLIVHLGLAFERYPVEFLNAVLDIKSIFPEIKMGMDKSIEYMLQGLEVLDTSSEKNKLLDRLAQNQSVFDMDKETAYLVGCLH